MISYRILGAHGSLLPHFTQLPVRVQAAFARGNPVDGVCGDTGRADHGGDTIGGYEQALPLSEEISHEYIDYLSDSALV
jgi:hypothetical protein